MVILIALATFVIGFSLGRRLEQQKGCAHVDFPEFDHDYVNEMLGSIDESLATLRDIAGVEPAVFETEAKPVKLGSRTVQRTDHVGSAAPHTEL